MRVLIHGALLLGREGKEETRSSTETEGRKGGEGKAEGEGLE